jgi:hypothetical protein
MRTPLIVGNWKMFKTVAETVKHVKALRALVKDITDVEIVVARRFRRFMRRPIRFAAATSSWPRRTCIGNVRAHLPAK